MKKNFLILAVFVFCTYCAIDVFLAALATYHVPSIPMLLGRDELYIVHSHNKMLHDIPWWKYPMAFGILLGWTGAVKKGWSQICENRVTASTF